MKGFKLQIPGSKTQDKDREFTSKDMECVHASLGSRNKLGACMHAGQIQWVSESGLKSSSASFLAYISAIRFVASAL